MLSPQRYTIFPITGLISVGNDVMGSNPAGRSIPERLSQDDARERLILEHLPQVQQIAKLVSASLPVRESYDDIVSAGILGLIHAIDSFKPSRNVKLDACTRQEITQAILDSVAEAGSAAPAPVDAEQTASRPEALVEEKELLAALCDGLRRLPDAVRAVLILHYAGNLKLREIAAIMHHDPSRITQLRTTGLHYLRAFLEHRGLKRASRPPLSATVDIP